jgi:hypothetical protein
MAIMKKVFLLFLLMSTFCFSQDIEMLDLINQYRIKHNVGKFIYNKDLSSISERQLNLIKEKDSVYHTDDESLQKKYSGEIALFSSHIFENDEQKKIFIKFIKQNFNFDYKEPENETEVIRLIKMLIIYDFNSSPKHRALLLNKSYHYIGFNYDISNIKKEDYMIKYRKNIYFPRFKFDCFCVMNLK